MPVLEEKSRPFDELRHVGIAIKKTYGGPQHIAIIYRLPDQLSRIVHLAFHHDLRDEVATPPYRWVHLNIDDLNAEILAILASRIAHSATPISYGFDSDGACFDSTTGEILSLPPGKGLTCATFVLAALRTYGYYLLDIGTWPERSEDIAWQESILSSLAEVADAAHIAAVRSDIGATRLRPDEVAGASTLPNEEWPTSFYEVRQLADQILDELG